LVSAQPYLSVAVVILTGIDTWIQAGTKWKSHYRYNDDYISAETELSGISADQTDQLQALRRKVDEIDSADRKEVLT
jgi:hypothetical protein